MFPTQMTRWCRGTCLCLLPVWMWFHLLQPLTMPTPQAGGAIGEASVDSREVLAGGRGEAVS